MKFPAPPHWDTIKGFLADREAAALYRTAAAVCPLGPVLEIGSYCGKSTLCLGLACQPLAGVVYALDHHHGSEEHQRGELFHDPELFDQQTAAVDTLGEFRRNIAAAQLTDTVIPVLASSKLVARHWQTPLAMVVY